MVHWLCEKAALSAWLCAYAGNIPLPSFGLSRVQQVVSSVIYSDGMLLIGTGNVWE